MDIQNAQGDHGGTAIANAVYNAHVPMVPVTADRVLKATKRYA